MPDAGEERDPFEALAAEFTERLRRGESPSVAEYAAKHPRYADEIRELFATILFVEQLKMPRRRDRDGRVSLGGPRLERLGDFRIVREIGRGGMGIVYEAEQESLGRRVAIKVLPKQALLDPKQLKRFQREARIAAGLHHTNIVEIFGVGEADGFHYFVMQFIPGVGLDRVISSLAGTPRDETQGTEGDRSEVRATPREEAGEIESLARALVDGPGSLAAAADGDTRVTAAGPSRLGPRYGRSVARTGLQVAEALGYAHAQGTLHRDIKPANLLMDAHGIVWVADFGLAKALQSEDVTLTGEIAGTLRYMAPEQFSGRTDARSDLYSLGLTLYELLALRPAYDEADQGRLIRQIAQRDPVPPRTFNAGIPRDLETIVLKATARNPDHRYPSAQELAADLRCFLEDRPIQARRARSVERLWRWSRRNPAVAVLAGTSLALLAVVAVVASAGYVRTKAALQGEERERGKAEASAALAMEAIDRIFERFSPSRTVTVSELAVEGVEGGKVEIPSPAALSKESAALLEEMLAFYERLARQAGNDDRLREKIAAANRRVGDIRQRLGQFEQAVAAYQRAIGMYEELIGRADNSGDTITFLHTSGEKYGVPRIVEIARIRNELGFLYRSARRVPEAREAHEKALTILQALPAEAAALPETRHQLARTHYLLGGNSGDTLTFLHTSGEKYGVPRIAPVFEPGGAGPRPPFAPGREFGTDPFVRPVPEFQPPFPPDGPEGARPPAKRPPRPGGPPPFPREGPPRPPTEPGPRDGAEGTEEHLVKAISLLDELVKQHPSNPNYRFLLALCHRERIPGLARRDRDAVHKALNQATEILERLVQDFPEAPDYRYELCETYAMPQARDPALSRDEPRGVEERLRKALDVSEKLAAAHPSIPQYQASQARILHELAIVLRSPRRLDEAERIGRKAVAVQAALVSQFPEVPDYQVWLAAFRNSWADMLLARGQPREARAALKDTVSSLEELLKKQPEMWFLHGLLAQGYGTLSAALRAGGEETLASDAARQAEEHRRAARRGPTAR
jgi:serine/threonine protein kinase